MNRTSFLYYIILLVTTGLTLRDAALASFNIDVAGIAIILFQFFLIILIFRRRSLTQVGIIGWSIIFISKNILPLIGFLLEHNHNDFENAEFSDIIGRVIKITIGIVFWIISIKVSFEKE